MTRTNKYVSQCKMEVTFISYLDNNPYLKPHGFVWRKSDSSIFCTLCEKTYPNTNKMKIHAETCKKHIDKFEMRQNCFPTDGSSCQGRISLLETNTQISKKRKANANTNANSKAKKPNAKKPKEQEINRMEFCEYGRPNENNIPL